MQSYKILISIFLISFISSKTLGFTISDSTFEDKPKKIKFLFAFDARRSFVLDRNVKFNGLKFGVEIFEKHRVGLGFYGMRRPVKFTAPIDRNRFPDASDTVFFNFNYTSSFYEYVWLKSKRWELSTPIHLGLGRLKLDYLDTLGNRSAPFIDGAAFVFGTAGNAQFKIFRWFAVGTGIGYRFMLTKDGNIRKALDAPVYAFHVKVLVGELYRMIFKRRTLEDW